MIKQFAAHRVAANLMVALVFLAGVWAISHLNTQFLPAFYIDVITIEVTWPGASPEDVERSITVPVEDKLKDLDHVKKLSSVSSRGLSKVVIEFDEGVDMSDALQKVTDNISQIRQFPEGSRKPKIAKIDRFERIAEVVLTSQDSLLALRPWAERFKQELLEAGVAKVTILGAADKELSVALTPESLTETGMNLNELAEKIRQQSQDVSAGVVGRDTGGRQLRNSGQLRTVQEYEQLPIVSGDSRLLFRLGEIAKIQKNDPEYAEKAYHAGQSALTLTLFRTSTADALASARLLRYWLNQVRPQLPQGMKIRIYNESWLLIYERILLLLKNGLGGLVLIFILLFLFLNSRVALWVAFGIPIAIATALFIMYLIGLSINMVSLFGLLMALGIIVDDTIVVGEEGVRQFALGKPPLEAAVLGARRMIVPVMAASLTTVAAFTPLLFMGGTYGKILFDIPLVVICVLLASLLEAFWILPNHLKSSFIQISRTPVPAYRQRLEAWFQRLRDIHFYRLIHWSVDHRWVVLAMVFALLLITLASVITGRPGFSFFPTPDGQMLTVDVVFAPGTAAEKMDRYMNELEHTAWQVNQTLSPPGKSVLNTLVRFHHLSNERFELRSPQRLASLLLELSSPSDRKVSNDSFIEAWEHLLKPVPWVDSVEIQTSRGGPRGKSIDIMLTGGDPYTLKKAALQLTEQMQGYAGVFNVVDDLPFAPDEYIFSLRPEAYVLGMSIDSIGQQLRAAFTGDLAQIFHEGQSEIEVRVRLQDSTRHQLASLETFPILTPQKKWVPLRSLCVIESRKNFDTLLHTDHRLAVHVTAEVDLKQANVNRIIDELKAQNLPELSKQLGVQYQFKGKVEDQARTLGEMKAALFFALGMIYIILAWVSGSYSWPILVMLAIPLGLMGAVWGHWLMGLDITLLSLFGFFGLTGIVINDSIILLLRYKEIREHGVEVREAIVEASCQRFRPVILTSMTTVAGLLPILFERSLQAQFLIPMATSICFGLAVATVLILIVIPTLLVWVDGKHKVLQKN